ncbi:MAG: hypothetical protein OET90_01825 [Desulfuromonadales bacterium]|nr:hypothetical protein [Desulfuromonadales bacterium]
MIVIPAICHSCNALYGARSKVLDGAILNYTLLGNNPVPCPFCGKIGYTIEGLYSSVSKAVQVIISSLNSEEYLPQLTKKLEECKSREIDPEIFRKELQQNIPELKNIADILPKTRSELYAFIAVLLTVTTMFISTITQLSNSMESVTKQNVEEIVREAIEKTISDKSATTQSH